MKNLLKTLGDNLKEDELLQKVIEIEEFYKEENINLYSETFLIVNDSESDELDYIIKNLQSILNILEERESSVCENIKKLIDFIQMEQMRETHIMNDYINKLSSMIENVSKRQFKEIVKQRNNIEKQFDNIMFDVNNKMNDISIEFNKQSNEIEKFNGNLVSVLGIFGAIIVAFFGGLSFLGGVLDNMHNVSTYRLTFMGLLYIIGLFNVIFLLFYCISKIVGKPLHSNRATIKNCEVCTQNRNLNCIIEKYSVVAYFNFICLFLLISIFILYLIDKFNICAQIIESIGWNSQNGLLILSIGAFIYSLFIILGYYICKNIKRKYDDLFTSCSNNNCSEIENATSMSSNFEVAAD